MTDFWLIDSSVLSKYCRLAMKTLNHTLALGDECVCVSCPAVYQCTAAVWLQVQLWQGPGKFLTPVPRYLESSWLSLTNDILKDEIHVCILEFGDSKMMQGKKSYVMTAQCTVQDTSTMVSTKSVQYSFIYFFSKPNNIIQKNQKNSGSPGQVHAKHAAHHLIQTNLFCWFYFDQRICCQ